VYLLNTSHKNNRIFRIGAGMKRIIIKFTDSLDYICVEADEFHEDKNFIKAYKGNELVAMADMGVIKTAYLTEQKD
jgi:hypothetical protein